MQDVITESTQYELFSSCLKITSEEEAFWLAEYLHEVMLPLET